MKVIFSSRALWQILVRRNYMVGDDATVRIAFVGSAMSIDGLRELDVTRQNENEIFGFVTSATNLARLRNILSAVPDHPVTINFPKDSSWIEIQHIEC